MKRMKRLIILTMVAVLFSPTFPARAYVNWHELGFRSNDGFLGGIGSIGSIGGYDYYNNSENQTLAIGAATGIAAAQILGDYSLESRRLEMAEREQGFRHGITTRVVDHALSPRRTVASCPPPCPPPPCPPPSSPCRPPSSSGLQTDERGAVINRSNEDIRNRFRMQELEKKNKKLEEENKLLRKKFLDLEKKIEERTTIKMKTK